MVSMVVFHYLIKMSMKIKELISKLSAEFEKEFNHYVKCKNMSDEELHDYLCTCLEDMVMQPLEENKLYDVSFCGFISFDSFMFNGNNVIYYKNNEEVQLSDIDVIIEIFDEY